MTSGWKLVPVVPEYKQLDAALRINRTLETPDRPLQVGRELHDAEVIYRAMLAAAPSPSEPTEEMVERAAKAAHQENGAIVRDYGSGNCPSEVAYSRLARAALRAALNPSTCIENGENLCASAEPVKETPDIQRIVFDWIRDDAPTTIKMTMTPDCCAKLVNRLAALNTPDGGEG